VLRRAFACAAATPAAATPRCQILLSAAQRRIWPNARIEPP